MFETSRDILNLVIALVVLMVGGGLAWLIYLIVAMMRDVRHATRSFKEKVEALDGLLDLLREKIEKSASYIGILVDLVSKLVSHFRDNRSADRPRRAKRSRKIAEAELDEDE